jgi:hypothetical protein
MDYYYDIKVMLLALITISIVGLVILKIWRE